MKDDNSIEEILRTTDNLNYAFNLLVDEYKRPLYQVIRRIVISHDDTDDVLQNTFIKVWKNLPSFKQESKLYTWVYRIAVNEALTFLKRKNKFLFIPTGNEKRSLLKKLESEPFFKEDEIEMKFQKALLSLPEKQKLVFNFRYYDELSYEDIAEITGTSVGALKASYHHAAKKIEEILIND